MELLMNLLTEINKKKAKIAKLTSEIAALQDSCRHNTERDTFGRHITYRDYVKKVHGSNTGNWCPADDCYWTDCECTLCGKRWREYGSL